MIILTIILMKKWENFKTIIKETKQQLIEKDESTETLKNKWYDEECKIAIEVWDTVGLLDVRS